MAGAVPKWRLGLRPWVGTIDVFSVLNKIQGKCSCIASLLVTVPTEWTKSVLFIIIKKIKEKKKILCQIAILRPLLAQIIYRSIKVHGK